MNKRDNQGTSPARTKGGSSAEARPETCAEEAREDDASTAGPAAPACRIYPQVPGISCKDFELPAAGLSAEQRTAALAKLRAFIATQKSRVLGYQVNLDLPYQQELKEFLNVHINNIGDPFQSGNYTPNSKVMERAVLDYFARLWNARLPHDPGDPESYWGYVLTMGSTEGNLYGLWNGRDYLAGKVLLEDSDTDDDAWRSSRSGGVQRAGRRLVYQQARVDPEKPNAYTPVAFYSQDTHYSVIKAMRVLDIHTFYALGMERYPSENPLSPGRPWPREVPSRKGALGPGEIDIEALAVLVEFFAARGYPILVCFNYGTTFKGAYDDVEAAGKALLPILEKYGLGERPVHYDPRNPRSADVRTGYWFHVDGALGAAYMPFIEMAYESGRSNQRGPNFDFRLPFVHSIVMSGHKWIGAPWPCGVYMTRTKLQMRPPAVAEYIGSLDTTFAGSRNGFSSVLLWDYVARHSYEGQIAKALYTESMAQHIAERLRDVEKRLGKELWVGRDPLSLSVWFKAVRPELVFKYSLSAETLYVNGQKRRYNHIYAMAHVTPALIDQFIADVLKPGAFPEQPITASELPDEAHVARGARPLIYHPHTGRGFKG